MSKELIRQIQDIRSSKVMSYITGDSQPIGSIIAEDAVRPLYEHLLSIGKNEETDLFLYSRGGDVSVLSRIVSMFREFCNDFSILVSYKAHSATTLDTSILTKKMGHCSTLMENFLDKEGKASRPNNPYS